MNISIINALWLILVGEKLELDDPKINHIIKLFDDFVRTTSGPVNPLVSILPHPSLAKLPILRDFLGTETVEKAFSASSEFIEPYIVEHSRTLDPENVRDFLDLMLLEVKNTNDEGSCFFGKKGLHPSLSLQKSYDRLVY